ncbi:MAG: hypothetical protein JO304_17820 [Solirubrobacterales bacterium]|nr:hypothetical protein [Solirubrobacterales bacterium]
MSSEGHVRDRDEQAPPVPPIRSLLYPGERWRFWLATAASVVFLALILFFLLRRGVPTLIGGVVFLVLTVGSVWWGLQIFRARLLGNSVKVTPASFPDLQEVLDGIRAQLGYEGRVDVYVADKSEPSVKLTTYLGTRVILIEGGLVAELLEPSKQPQLRFLIARHIGALKARQNRLEPLLVMLQAADALQFVKIFLLPYYRSIAYSGDQIGLACCGSVEAALEATGRLLVGKELADDLPLGGVLPQGALVKERLLPRFAQFLSATPHVINRYLNLLMCGRLTDPAAWERFAASLAAGERFELDQLWRSSPHRRRAQGQAGALAHMLVAPTPLNFPPPQPDQSPTN